MVAAHLRLVGQAREERREGGEWVGLRLEAGQLRMMAVTLGLTGQDFLGQQRLPPGRDQALRVEVAGMHGPQSHRT